MVDWCKQCYAIWDFLRAWIHASTCSCSMPVKELGLYCLLCCM